MTAGRERAAAWALIAAQILHGIVPAPTSEHSAVGPIAGLLLLALSLAAVIGLVRGKHAAHALLGWTGFSVAVGFVLYHALPWHTPFTRPYVGEAVGAAAWASVAIAVAAGLCAAVAGLRSRSMPSPFEVPAQT